MKTILLLFLSLWVFQSVKAYGFFTQQDARNALKQLNKIKRKYAVICKAKDSGFSKDKALTHDVSKEWHEFIKICEASTDPSISRVSKEYKQVIAKQQEILQETKIGKAHKLSSFRSSELARLAWDEKDPVKKKELEKKFDKYEKNIAGPIRNKLNSLTSALRQRETDLYDRLFKDNGVCGKNTTDPKVHKAYKRYKNKETKCSQLESNYLRSLNKYTKLIIEYSKQRRNASSKNDMPEALSGTGSVK